MTYKKSLKINTSKAFKMQTDNSYFYHKIKLRECAIDILGCKEIVVLECYSGKGLIWDKIKKRNADKNITVIKIDTKPKTKTTLKGHNLKYLQSMDLNAFNIIDLDAYGVPFEQCEILFKKEYSGIVCVTFMQSVFGRLPFALLTKLGYPKNMVLKCLTLFNTNGYEKFMAYLGMNGIRQINQYVFKDQNKYYYFFYCIDK